MAGTLLRIFAVSGWLFFGGAVLAAASHDLINRESPYDRTRAQLMALEVKIRAYVLDTHTLPRTLQDLIAAADIHDWNGPYARPIDIVDTCDRPIAYEALDTAKQSFRLTASAHGKTPAKSELYEP